MTIDEIFTGLLYLAAVYLLFYIGKLVYSGFHRGFELKTELVKKDNFAMALAIAGYYFGLVIALGGVLSSESTGWMNDLIDIGFYGIISIFLLNLSIILNDKLILSEFDNRKEIIDDQNAGTGIVEAANHIAVGLIIFGAMSGEGDLITASVFWLVGQAVLILAGIVYNAILPFDLHDEIEKDNAAVGIAFAGALVAIGNVIRIGAEGDFVSWSENLTVFAGFVGFGLLMLPLLRYATDKLLLPGENLSDELVNQENPNIGAGVIEAFSYIGASFLLGWVV